ncbi:MAG TPA: ATP-binding protein, partial [Phototrophicaceae bacterium]|nr:ATP-binding protein [Phototrophicaceae bacterium]
NGGFSGEVPLLTNTPYIASGKAVIPTRLLRICAEDFRQMLTVCAPVNSTILPEMAKRLQAMDNNVRQYEKMSALGKLAAGLAHELNNPAAAARRTVEQLREHLDLFQSLSTQLGCLSPEEMNALIAFRATVLAIAANAPELHPLTRSDREGELTDWLAARGIQESWNLAPALVAAGVQPVQLDDFAAQIPPPYLGDVLGWLNALLNLNSLLYEVDQSTFRISELVKAVKSYAYMDQTPQQAINIHKGLDDTLVILRHKLGKGIEIKRDYDVALPLIQAYGNELNQVWTNLIDNAIDALDGHGAITLQTAADGDQILVTIADNGPGIPLDIQPRVFEPFFTTKPMGKGSGLGLDTVYRIVVQHHHGGITLESRPGDTRFIIRLPVKQPAEKG